MLQFTYKEIIVAIAVVCLIALVGTSSFAVFDNNPPGPTGRLSRFSSTELSDDSATSDGGLNDGATSDGGLSVDSGFGGSDEEGIHIENQYAYCKGPSSADMPCIASGAMTDIGFVVQLKKKKKTKKTKKQPM